MCVEPFAARRQDAVRRYGRDDRSGKAGSAETAPDHQLCAASIAGFARCSLNLDRSVVSDGLQCFPSVADAGCTHQVVKTGSGPTVARTPALK